jgi:hypothetical protein
VKSLGDVKELVKGENMFRIHSVGAAFFGALLLLFPDILISSGPIASFAYRQWSVFILTVAFITYKAPSLESQEAKQLLASAFCGMCAGETMLYTRELLTTAVGHAPANVLLIDAVSFAVFAGIAAGYYASGLTSFNGGDKSKIA